MKSGALKLILLPFFATLIIVICVAYAQGLYSIENAKLEAEKWNHHDSVIKSIHDRHDKFGDSIKNNIEILKRQLESQNK